MSRSVDVLAHAKINISLEVLGHRDDGYHQVATLLHRVDLADRLSFRLADDLSLKSDVTCLENEDNLVLKAARSLKERTGCTLGTAITLEKNVPVAGGLGGGSSDAATTLTALNKLWELELNGKDLIDLAAQLGSDVPFFLEGACALAEGRGEVVTVLPAIDGWWAVILSPPPVKLEDKTARLYSMLGDEEFTDGSATRWLADRVRSGAATMSDFVAGKNAFEQVATGVFPDLDEYRTALLKAGAAFVRLSGSGPTLFTLTDSREEGERILGRLKGNGHKAYLVELL